jgi:hypothetical protein
VDREDVLFWAFCVFSAASMRAAYSRSGRRFAPASICTRVLSGAPSALQPASRSPERRAVDPAVDTACVLPLSYTMPLPASLIPDK